MASTDRDALLEALNARDDEPIPPTWLVMQFGAGPRPHVAVSGHLELALAHFYQLAYMIVALDPASEYKVAGGDEDYALRGLSLYADDILRLTLQPAPTITPHPLHRVAATLPDDSFEVTARLLLAALEMRHELSEEVTRQFMNSAVARSFVHDVDVVMLEESVPLTVVKSEFGHSSGHVERMWEWLQNSRVMLAYI